MSKSLKLICPRCRFKSIQILATSPVKNIWEIYQCNLCLYAWRSTEPEENINPNNYPLSFRLQAEQISNFPIVPAIPPLRTDQSED